MKKKLTTVDFRGTAEQEAKLLEIIAKYDGVQGKMMPILQEAQEIYGYLPIEVQKIIADKTGIPAEQIYGVVSFYSQFKLNPDGEVAVAVCLGTACYVKGSGDILNKIKEIIGIDVGECTPDGKFSLEATRCIGACGLAPVLTINEEVYGRLVVGDIPDILKKYMD
jgi:NADP-reducing hydrogenase subunit HndA